MCNSCPAVLKFCMVMHSAQLTICNSPPLLMVEQHRGACLCWSFSAIFKLRNTIASVLTNLREVALARSTGADRLLFVLARLDSAKTVDVALFSVPPYPYCANLHVTFQILCSSSLQEAYAVFGLLIQCYTHYICL